jgi:hypothetical protein
MSLEPLERSETESTDPEPNPDQPRHAPGVVAPSNRVNVAFPFSKITVQEASQELAELTVLVDDLVEALEASTGQELKEIRQRANALAARFA